VASLTCCDLLTHKSTSVDGLLCCCRFVGQGSHIEARNMLEGLQDGVFLIRESNQSDTEYAIGLR